MDYTIIELFESDGIMNYFKIDLNIFKNKECLKETDIFILQYPKNYELSFSDGRITSIKDEYIIHNASTDHGSSGSPIIRRINNKIIGLHFGGNKKDSYNIGTSFDSILKDIKIQLKENYIEINCIYNGKEIDLLNDYNNSYAYNKDMVFFQIQK